MSVEPDSGSEEDIELNDQVFSKPETEPTRRVTFFEEGKLAEPQGASVGGALSDQGGEDLGMRDMTLSQSVQRSCSIL